MPRLRPKPQHEHVVYTQAVCVEGFSSGWSDPIPRGRIYPADHPMVRAHPEFWRLLGPRPNEEVK
jgi:hypothetical protein